MTRWIEQDRAVVFFDLETTGTNAKTDRIVEIALIRIEPNGIESTFHSLVNPGIPIPIETTRVHGISDQDVATAPSFQEIAERVAAFMGDSDIAGFNVVRFDLDLLVAEFQRVGVPFDREGRRAFDAMTIYHQRERRDLSAAHLFYCEKPLENAHSALADTQASLRIMRAQFDRYPDLPTDPDELNKVCNKPRHPDAIDRDAKLIRKNGEPVLNFGQKHAGEPLRVIAETDRGYLEWIAGRGDFSPEVKAVVAEVLAECKARAAAGKLERRSTSMRGSRSEMSEEEA
ncbi:MAG: 3'-5' exonuclease [Candidatus Hydrogenedentota bacterium]